MKYIRTTSGNIISYDENADEIDKPMILKSPSNIIKVADTVKEVCDELVIDDKTSSNSKPFTYPDSWENVLKKEVGENLDFCVGKDGAIYGAIWVRDRKGLPILKPVAKMNDEGKLKLL